MPIRLGINVRGIKYNPLIKHVAIEAIEASTYRPLPAVEAGTAVEDELPHPIVS